MFLTDFVFFNGDSTFTHVKYISHITFRFSYLRIKALGNLIPFGNRQSFSLVNFFFHLSKVFKIHCREYFKCTFKLKSISITSSLTRDCNTRIIQDCFDETWKIIRNSKFSFLKALNILFEINDYFLKIW